MTVPVVFHKPVMLHEVISGICVKKGKKYIDATAGGGGYGLEIVKQGGVLLAIDQDQEAIAYLKEKFQISNIKFQSDKEIFIRRGNFKVLREIAKSIGWENVDGIVFDLGMSSHQLDQSGRGFSYKKDEPLDMRMDMSSELTAADIIRSYSKQRLYEIFSQYGEELNSRTIAEAVLSTRTIKKIESTYDLVKIIEEALRKVQKNDLIQYYKIRNATLARIFQALRIEVNDELISLSTGLEQAIQLLNPSARLAVVSYHSLEDRIVKSILKQLQQKHILNIATHKPLQTSHSQIQENPRAKSAKLRIAQKI